MRAHSRRRGPSFSQRNAFGLHRPHIFMIAEPEDFAPREIPQPAMAQESGDFFSDTFGQEMAKSMHHMEEEMQQQMRSMDLMHKELEERLAAARPSGVNGTRQAQGLLGTNST